MDVSKEIHILALQKIETISEKSPLATFRKFLLERVISNYTLRGHSAITFVTLRSVFVQTLTPFASKLRKKPKYGGSKVYL